jgi:hypothetical protein
MHSKKDHIERLVDVVLMRRPIGRLGNWIDRKVFKIDVYELRGHEVVPYRRKCPPFSINEVSSWQQVFISFGVPLIVIKFADGRTLELSDRHKNLFGILQDTLPEKELPWKAV